MWSRRGWGKSSPTPGTRCSTAPSATYRCSTTRVTWSGWCLSAISCARRCRAGPGERTSGHDTYGSPGRWIARVRAAPLLLSSSAHHVLDPRVVLEAVDGQVLPVPGVLEAAVWHLGDERDVGVDPHAAEVEARRHPHRPRVVPGPHRGCQPELHVVRPLDRLVLVDEALHRDDRAEDLLLDDLVVLSEAGDHCGLVEEPPIAEALPARLDLGVVREAFAEAAHPFELHGTVERADVHVGIVRAAELTATCSLGESGDQVVVNPGTRQHTGGRGAVLARVEVPGHRDPLCGRLHVGVVENDDRGLAAQFEMHPLRSSAAALAISRPARTLPVMETMRGIGLSSSAAPIS